MEDLPEGYEVHQTGDKVPEGYTLWKGVHMLTPMFNALSALRGFILCISLPCASPEKMSSIVINCLRAAKIKPLNVDQYENSKSLITKFVYKFKKAKYLEKHWVSEICLCITEEAYRFSQEWVEEQQEDCWD